MISQKPGSRLGGGAIGAGGAWRRGDDVGGAVGGGATITMRTQIGHHNCAFVLPSI